MDSALVARLGSPYARIWSLLREELAPFPGRIDAVWRYVLSSALVIVLGMTLQIPFISLSLILVFFTAQENTVVTVKTGVSLAIGANIAIVLSILLLKYTIDYAFLRLPCTWLIIFCSLYFLRISRVGMLGFLVALVLITVQNVADSTSDPETLLRATLWIWVAWLYPIAITIIVSLLLFPPHPVRLLNDEIKRQLDQVVAQLEARRNNTAPQRLSLSAIERGVLTLHRHLSFAALGDDECRRHKERHLMRITAVDRLHTAAVQLSRMSVDTPTPAQYDLMGRLQSACHALQESVESRQPFMPQANVFDQEPVGGLLDTVLREMADALEALAGAESLPPSDLPAVKEGLITADALSNPVYVQFALKTVLAIIICYIFISAAQWPGISTAMVTCVICALPSVGANSHKGTLRALGCALGSLAALLATVFVMPHIESITGLLFMMLPVIAAGAWIAAGSARTNYIGVQLAFAFALAMLSGFGPSIDLSEIRDRMVGILLGVTVSVTVFSIIWPEREGAELRKMLARLLHSIAALARTGDDAGDDASTRREIDQARLQCWTLLARNRELQTRVALEPGWQYAHDSVTVEMQTWFAQAQEVLFAVNATKTFVYHAGATFPAPLAHAFEAFRRAVAQRIEEVAREFDARPGDQASPMKEPDSSLQVLITQAQDAGAAAEIVTAMHTIDERIAQLGSRLPLSLRESSTSPTRQP